ncbi:tetratricopeptide repeat (TPR)-like superfamily protein isoform X1 [Carex rostrata]
MPEAAILSQNLSPALRPPNLNRKKQKPKAPILREYNRPPFKPRLLNVRRDISASVPDSSASLQYYASLASSLAQCGRLADFLMIAESVLSGGAHPKFIANINVRMVSEGIAYVLKNSGLKGVLDFVSKVERVGITAYQLFDEKSKRLLRVECTRLSVEGRLEELVSVMETLSGYQFPIQGIIDPTDVLTKFVDRQDLDLAKRFISLYPQSQLLFSSLIEEFGKKNDLRSAMEVFELLKEQPGGINKFACRSIIDVCGLCGDFMQSRAIFEGLIEEGIVLNVYVLNSLMNVNAHDLSYTLGVYRRMQALGVEADIASYNILLKACCNVRRVDLALKIYEELKAVGGRGSLELDAYTYTSMIKVLSAEGMWETVLTIKEDMSSAGVRPNLITWSLILSTCANCGLADRALKLFDEMLRDNCLPNTHCCNTILHACVKSFQFDRAFHLYHFWRACGIRIPPEMESKADSIMNPFASPFKPTVFTFNILMKACGTDYHRARALVREMTGLGIPPDVVTWSTLIDICGKARYVKGALLALKDMKASGIKLDVQAYTVAIKACVENKELKIAFFLFDEMKRYQVQPNRATYNTLLRARTNYGSLYEVQQSLAIYQEMRKAGFSANDYYLKGLIEEWCEEVLCSRNRDDSSAHILKKRTEQQKHYHLFFEKVATHLQNDKEHDRVIDVRGLSKVEARILVLSVLRMMKENYFMGEVTKENMVIFTGADAVSIPAVSNSLEVQHAIIHVLKDELGLTVNTGYGNKPDIVPHGSLLSPVSKAEGSSKYSARRPQNLGVVTVPVESLHQWLHKRNHK